MEDKNGEQVGGKKVKTLMSAGVCQGCASPVGKLDPFEIAVLGLYSQRCPHNVQDKWSNMQEGCQRQNNPPQLINAF